MSWFDVEKLDNTTYVISENKHYEKTNIYYLIGDSYNICIDSGIGLQKISGILNEIDSKEKRVIVTHSHWDHIGNLDEFEQICLHPKAKDYLKSGGLTPINKARAELIKGVEAKYIPEGFRVEEYQYSDVKRAKVIKEDELIDLGNRKLEVINTPGHTPDSISIFDKSTGYLFVGDLFYSGKLYCNSAINSPIDYFNTLEKLAERKNGITKILSGHYDPDLGRDYLDKAFDLFKRLKMDGLLEQGAGEREYKGMEIIL